MLDDALAAAEPRRLADFESLGPVVDTDAQLQETVDVLLEYMDDDASAKRFISLADLPRDMVYAGPSGYPLYEYKRRNGGREPVAGDEVDAVIDADTLASRLEANDVDTGVVNPTLNLGLSEVNNDRFAVALARAYNDWLLDELDGQPDLVGNAVVAPHDPHRAAEEIDRVAGEAAVVGLQLPATGLVPPPGHARYEPIFDAAETHGLPIAMKTTVGNKPFGTQYWWSSSFAEDFVYQHGFVQMRNLTSLLYEGVPERHPDLQFVVQGAGVGYVPYFAYRLDDHYLELGYEIPALERLPSAYLDESFYWSTAPIDQPGDDPTYLAAMVEMIGPENVVFGSDLPHAVTDLPRPLVDRLRPYVEADDLRALMGANAVELYGL